MPNIKIQLSKLLLIFITYLIASSWSCSSPYQGKEPPEDFDGNKKGFTKTHQPIGGSAGTGNPGQNGDGDDGVDPEQNTVGNGGDVLNCEDPQHPAHRQILDHYEALEKYKLQLDSNIFPGKTGIIIWVNEMIAKVTRLDSEFGKQLKTEHDFFWKNVRFKPNIVLADVPDSLQNFLPADCQLKQIAIQKPPGVLHGAYYTVSLSEWENLDNLNRAMLVLHEIVYKIALTQEHDNSRNARYLTAVIASQWLSTATKEEWEQVLAASEIKVH